MSETRKEKVMQWIAANVVKSEYLFTKMTSYGMKHLYEKDCQDYISNELFIRYMRQSGYDVFKADKRSPNVNFYCSLPNWVEK